MQVLSIPTSKNTIAEHEQVLSIALGSFMSSVGLFAFLFQVFLRYSSSCIIHTMLEETTKPFWIGPTPTQ